MAKAPIGPRAGTAAGGNLPVGFAPALLVSFFAGLSITYSQGHYSEPAMTMVLAALLATIWYFVGALRSETPSIGISSLWEGLVWSALFAMVWTAWNDPIMVVYRYKNWDLGPPTQVASLLLLMTYLPSLLKGVPEPQSFRLARFAAFGVLLLLAGYDTVRTSPRPQIDVWTVQMEGARLLEQGKNPFTQVAVVDTGPRVGRDVPHVYPPTQLYLSTLGHRLAGDVRFTMLAALLISGVAFRHIVKRAQSDLPSFIEDAPTLFLWLTPKLFFILEQSWVDPSQLMLITLTVVAFLAGRPWLTATLLGLTVSSKQTMFWVMLLFGFMLRLSWRQWIIAAVVAAATVLPFAVWDLKGLFHSNIEFVSSLPPRPDALTFNNWFLYKFGLRVPGALGFGIAGLVTAIAIWRMRGSIASLGVALLLTYLTFFAFNKWAFANYYFFIAGLAALAAALSFVSKSDSGRDALRLQGG